MIQQIYITDYLSDAAADMGSVISRLAGHCPMLLKADWQVSAQTPLRALFATLSAPGNTSAISSPVSAVLQAGQAWAQAQPVLCLLPVHLGLQRDTFSLQGTIALSSEVYAYLTHQLQQHFQQAFLVQATPGQRYWWIQPLKPLEVQSPWPQDYLYQQAFHWQPQGRDASLLRQWANESQMLLHQLSSGAGFQQDSLQKNSQPAWPSRLNSLWFASVPEMPAWQHDWQAVFGIGAVFEGLQASQLPAVKQLSLAQSLQESTTTKALMVADDIEQVDWQTLQVALQKGRLSAVEIVLPLAERSVRISYKKAYRWQFWRKAYSLESLFARLEASLPSSKLPEAA